MFHEYEIIIVVRPDLDDADVISTIESVEESITGTGGSILEREEWGKRKLAYMIQKHTKGFYTLLNVISDPTKIIEIERRMRLTDRVIRFLTVKIAHQVDAELRIEQAEEIRSAREKEAKAKAEEAEAAAAAKAAEAEAEAEAATEETPAPPAQ